MYVDIKEKDSEKKDWEKIDGQTKEEMYPNISNKTRKGLLNRDYIDADFAYDKVSRWSRTGFILMFNNITVFWLSKKNLY